MKALTICQPYADLILLPESDRRHKRVENRTWDMRYRGPLVIHAGKSRQWLHVDQQTGIDKEYGFRVADLLFGYALGVVDVVGCYGISIGPRGVFHDESAYTKFPWLRGHQHVEGPHCIVLQNVRRFKSPFLWRGAQGLFDIPDHTIAEALRG